MVGNNWDNSPNSSKSLPNCPKMTQNVPKCPLQTHRCPNGLVFLFAKQKRFSLIVMPLKTVLSLSISLSATNCSQARILDSAQRQKFLLQLLKKERKFKEIKRTRTTFQVIQVLLSCQLKWQFQQLRQRRRRLRHPTAVTPPITHSFQLRVPIFYAVQSTLSIDLL